MRRAVVGVSAVLAIGAGFGTAWAVKPAETHERVVTRTETEFKVPQACRQLVAYADEMLEIVRRFASQPSAADIALDAAAERVKADTARLKELTLLRSVNQSGCQ